MNSGDEKGSNVDSQRYNRKLFVGVALLMLTPVLLFVKPVTTGAILRDVALLLWWSFVFWLIVSGLKTTIPKNSK